MIKTRLSVSERGRLIKRSSSAEHPNLTAAKKDITANTFSPAIGFGSTSITSHGGPAFNTTFMGIIPEYNENLLLQYYRDCYYYDSVAGATVDIISNFPFSDWTLTGIENKHIPKFSESLARLNMRPLLQEMSMTHLVDGAYVGSLVYNSTDKIFQDILTHDVANTTISPQPFYSIDPVLTVNSANKLNEFMDSGSPYIQEVLRAYPKELLDTFKAGPAVLDPLTTIFLPRKGLQDRTHASYLKRLLPVYMLEKILYRGTLTEASKRLRSTSHITIGDDLWEPTPQEMASILADFQRSELDPLGAWVATRQGVNVNDIRPGGEFWKWTDTIDTLTPFKLRALGISEAFLAGDASYATAEAAISIFLDNMDAYRGQLSYRVFTSKIFPLIAVLNGLYKNPSEARPIKTSGDLLFNINNQKNLLIPEIRWHKSLEGKNKDSEFDMLEKLSEKGFVVPLKMWAAACGVDVSMLVRDLEEDHEIKKKIQEVTGIVPGGTGGDEESGEAAEQDLRFAFRAGSLPFAGGKNRRTVPLLSRSFSGEQTKLSKSGDKVHAVINESRSNHRVNDIIVKASRALKDPHHRATIRASVAAKLGIRTNLGLSG
jgi:hypothetical protein